MGLALRSSPSGDEDIHYVRTPSNGRPAFDELAVVTLTEDVKTIDDLVVPAGSVGTIVSVWDGGKEYEIEFAAPVGTLATVPCSKLREV